MGNVKLLVERLDIMEIKENQMKLEEKEFVETEKQSECDSKQLKKDTLVACRNRLSNEFDKKIEEFGFNNKYELYNILLRKELIDKIANTASEHYFLDNNYEKILNATMKKYELNEKYKEEKAKKELEEYNKKMQPVWEKEKKKEENKEKAFFILFKIWSVIKWIFVGIFAFIVLFLKSLSDMSKKK